MMARSVSSANPINRRQTPAALPLVLLFPAEFQRFALGSAADWADSTRPLPIFSRFADFASALQQEAISTLGRFAKRILDFLLASIAILLLCPLMPAIAVAVRLESQGPAIYPSLHVGKRGMLFAQYGPRHEEHLEVTPGITGLWQVTARQNLSLEICMPLDLGYIRDWSMWLDCKILLRTIPAVLAGEGP